MKNCENDTGKRDKELSSPDSKAYTCHVFPVILKSCSVESGTGVRSFISPTGILRDRESAATLTPPGIYFYVGVNSSVVQYQRTIFPDKFFPLKKRSVTVVAVWLV